MCNDRTSPYRGIIAYRHTWYNDDITTYPHITPYMNRLSIFNLLIPKLYIKWMTSSVERAIRGNKYIISECHLSLIKNDTISISKEIRTHFDVITIVTEERSNDKHTIASLSKQLSQTFHTFLPT